MALTVPVPIEFQKIIKTESLSVIRSLLYFIENPNANPTQRDLVAYTGLVAQSVDNALQTLKQKRYIYRDGNGWVVTFSAKRKPFESAAKQEWNLDLNVLDARADYLAQNAITSLTAKDMVRYFCQLYQRKYDYPYCTSQYLKIETVFFQRNILERFFSRAKANKIKMSEVEIEVLEYLRWAVLKADDRFVPSFKLMGASWWKWVNFKYKRKVAAPVIWKSEKKSADYETMTRGDILRDLDWRLRHAKTNETREYLNEQIQYYDESWEPAQKGKPKS